MVRRRKKKTSHTLVYIISIVVVLLIAGIYYSGIFQKKIIEKIPTISGSGNIQTGANEQNFYANTIVSGTGKLILIPYDIKIGTKYKIEYNDKELFAKSDKYILENYIDDNVLFSGEVIGFATDNTPVLNITNIDYVNKELGTGNEILSGENNEQTDNIVNYKNISLNLENTDYQTEISGDVLFIYKTGTNLSGDEIKENLFEIESYKCEKGSSLYDCDAFKEQAKVFNFKTLISNNGLTFYKLTETNQYVLVGNEYGYNIFPKKGSIYNLVDLINLEKNNIKNKKTDLNELAKLNCKNDKISLTEVIKITKNANIYDIVGYDKYSNKILCKLSVQEGNPTIAKLISLEFLKSNKQLTGETIVDNQIDDTKYLIYKSKGYGFTLYIPKSTKYKSMLIKNSLGISGLMCVQQVNIADWKSGDLKDPELKVLYCKTNLDTDSLDQLLETKKTSYKIIKTNGKTFIILYKNTDIAQNLLNNLIIK